MSTKQKTIVVAGANGFMGNRFITEAFRHNVNVIALARNSNEESAENRILLELEENITPDLIEKYRPLLTVYPYDISKPDLGLSPQTISKINKSASAVFNFVGNTNFFPKDVQQLFTTNVDGVEHLLLTLCRNKAVFNHVSTAYVCGARAGVVFEDELNVGQEFKNHYEKSKMIGEMKVQEVCSRYGIPYNVFRPSIVIRKHSLHGKSPNLNHFYSFVGLIDIMRQDAQNASHSEKKEKLEVHVRFPGKKQSTLNFVDLDYSIQALFSIGMQQHKKNMTYHLVNGHPLTNQKFIEAIMKLYNIHGFEILEDRTQFTNLNFYEKLIKRGLANYIDYFYVNPVFDETNCKAALAGTKISCPDFDIDYISHATGHFHK